MINKFLETFRVSVLGITSNKLRSFLTMIGITIGVAAVILLMSAGQAVQAYITNQFTSLGANLISASPSRDEQGRSIAFDMGDVNALSNRDNAPHIAEVLPQFNTSKSAVYEATSNDLTVDGVTVGYLDAHNRSVTEGRFFTQAEYDSSARVAVIGRTTATNFFGATDPVGNVIRVGGVRFEIIGLLKSAGSMGPMDNDDLLMVPMSTAQSRLGAGRSLRGEYIVSSITVKAADSDSVTAAQSEMETVLRESRGIDTGAGQSDNFRVFSASSILSSLTSTIGMLTIFLGVVAGISLLVGGIGVMNIMLVTVTERTREIGLRKAVGAHNFDIVFQFLVESIVLTLFGGAVGVALAFAGVLIAQHVSALSSLPITVQMTSVILAVAISAAIGIFFGIYPARRAAALNPIDALRYE